MATIGFIGLGNMGAPMAANLVRAGHQVTGFDLVPRAVEALAAEGGHAAASVAEAAAAWDREGRQSWALYRGSRLAAAAGDDVVARARVARVRDRAVGAQRVHHRPDGELGRLDGGADE